MSEKKPETTASVEQEAASKKAQDTENTASKPTETESSAKAVQNSDDSGASESPKGEEKSTDVLLEEIEEMVSSLESSKGQVPQPTVAQSPQASGDMDLQRRISHIIQTITYTQQWILLADTKGGLLLTANGVIAGFILQKFSELSKFWSVGHPLMIGGLFLLFACYAYFQIESFLHTMWTVLPRPMSMPQEHLKKTRHVFNYSLTLHFPKLEDNEKLIQEYEALSEKELFEEYVTQLHIDSVVCTNKYSSFMKGFRGMRWALLFGGMAFLGSIFAIQSAEKKIAQKKVAKQAQMKSPQKRSAKIVLPKKTSQPAR